MDKSSTDGPLAEAPVTIISFLGTANYKSTTYIYTNQAGETLRCTTPFFAEALTHYFPNYRRVLVLATPTVQSHANLSMLQQRIPSDRLEVISIPESHSEQALWTIFERLTTVVDEHERVIFDITHSFRSLPFLAFLAAAFLRAARHVRVEALLYGAYEAHRKVGWTTETPVFNLTPFVELLDWLTATTEFIYTGNAGYLARQLNRVRQQKQSSTLKGAARLLDEFSLAIMLCRPWEVLESADKLQKGLNAAEADLQTYVPPFAVLRDLITASYAMYGVADPDDEGQAVPVLRKQLGLIDWYVEKHQVIQAMTLAREWLISAVSWRLQKRITRDRKERESLARALSYLSHASRPCGRPQGSEKVQSLAAQIQTWHNWKEAVKLMDQIAEVRNDLDHAGMTKRPTPTKTLVRNAETKIKRKLHLLAQHWDLEAEP